MQTPAAAEGTRGQLRKVARAEATESRDTEGQLKERGGESGQKAGAEERHQP